QAAMRLVQCIAISYAALRFMVTTPAVPGARGFGNGVSVRKVSHSEQVGKVTRYSIWATMDANGGSTTCCSRTGKLTPPEVYKGTCGDGSFVPRACQFSGRVRCAALMLSITSTA